MITEKDLEKQNTFFKYGRGDSYKGEWYQGHFDCGLQVVDDRIVFFLHDEVYGKKWFIRSVESLEDLELLFNILYPKDKFEMGKNSCYY